MKTNGDNNITPLITYYRLAKTGIYLKFLLISTGYDRTGSGNSPDKFSLKEELGS